MLLTAGFLQASPMLYDKIVSLIGEDAYARNEAFIHIIFSPESAYEQNGRLDVVKVADRLKENGLLTLFFDSHRMVELTFRTNGDSRFFLALMGDVLRDMGYYRYLTESAASQSDGFVWKIRMDSEYATDPTILQRELSKRGCSILDIQRESPTQWHYDIDMQGAYLDAPKLVAGKTESFKRMVYPHWFDVHDVGSMNIWSLKGNNWYPYIAFYDDSLRLLKLYKRDRRSWQLRLRLPRGCAYVKVADLYSRKNMKAGLRVLAE